jgi:inorganic phosphate transporter, PiT family
MWMLSSGLLLGWSLGANHTANVFGTGVATGTVSYRAAILLTAGFLVLGAILEGPKCMNTVGALSRLTPIDAFYCALAAGIMMSLLTFFSVPGSASQAIIGAVIGAGVFLGSADFTKLYKILVCWACTPFSAIIISYTLYRLLGCLLDKATVSITQRNLIYRVGTVLTGCFGAYCLGSNNVANVTGVYFGADMLTAEDASVIGGLSIASGVLTYSKKVMMTIGKGIAPLDPFSALVAVLAGALTMHLFTQVGVPVSSSQAIVGAVVGIGIAGNVRTVSIRMLTKITVGWVSAPAAAALLAYLFIRFDRLKSLTGFLHALSFTFGNAPW